MLINRLNIAILVFFSSFSAFGASNEIIFAAAPTHSVEDTKNLYTPVLKFLSEKTGRKFVLEVPATFIEYSNNIQADHYDMAFDGPHLAGWRIEKKQHAPVVKLPGEIKIVIIAKLDSRISSVSDLGYGWEVCAFSPPNMLTMAMLSHFPNPVRQPELVRVKEIPELLKCVKSGKGQAAVLRDKMWLKAKKSGAADGLKIIPIPERGYPERTITAGPNIDEKLRQQIAHLLLSDEGKKVAEPLMKKLNKKQLIEAHLQEYEGLGSLLNTVWGFK